MKIRLPELTSAASRAGRQARSTSSIAPPLLSVAQTPRFQTYLGPVKYSNMAATVPVVTTTGKPDVLMRGITASCLPARCDLALAGPHERAILPGRLPVGRGRRRPPDRGRQRRQR